MFTQATIHNTPIREHTSSTFVWLAMENRNKKEQRKSMYKQIKPQEQPCTGQ